MAIPGLSTGMDGAKRVGALAGANTPRDPSELRGRFDTLERALNIAHGRVEMLDNVLGTLRGHVPHPDGLAKEVAQPHSALAHLDNCLNSVQALNDRLESIVNEFQRLI